VTFRRSSALPLITALVVGLTLPATATAASASDGPERSASQASGAAVASPSVTPTEFTNTTVGLTGDPVYGGTLRADLSTWVPQPTDVYYAWIVNGVRSDLYTGPTLPLNDDVFGASVAVMVTGAHADGVADLADVALVSPAVTIRAASFSGVKVRLNGSARPGSTLTADVSSWVPRPADVTYRWTGVAGRPSADGSSYTVLPADASHRITVTASGWQDFYEDASATTSVTVGIGTFAKAPTPSISGTVRVGNSVKASVGTWSPSATFSYQWKQNGHAISGATHATYTPSASYRGKKLTVTVTAKRSGYTTVTRTSAAKTIGYGVLVAPTPKITGTRRTGHTLKVSVGTWKPKPSFSYQWKRNGSTIKGATHTSYKTTSADRGKKITVTVTGKKSGYTTRAVTSASASVTAPFKHTSAPTITGTTRVYSKLTAHVKAWSPKAVFSYQWKRDGKAIKGATHSTYKLTATDYHRRITVTATGKRGSYTTTSRTSAKTASISAPKATLTKNGTYKVGSQIAPGTYISSASAEGCYWERRSSAGSSLSGVVANDFADGQQIVTITAKDRYFKTTDCGTWTRFVALGGVRTSIPGDGVFAVNSQLKPGTYRTSGPAAGSYGCYWEIDSDFLGGLDSIIDNGNEYGSAYVTIDASDKGFRTSGCATWKRVGA